MSQTSQVESGLLGFAKTRVQISRPLITAALAEMFATLVVSIFIHGARCQTYLLSLSKSSATNLLLGGPIGVLLAPIISDRISGGHVNPAITLGIFLTGEIGWKKAGIYWIAQLLGAFLGFGIVYALYASKFRNHFGENGLKWIYPDPASDQHHCDSSTNCPIFSSSFAPTPEVFAGRSFANQIIASTILLIVILAVVGTNKRKTSRLVFGVAHAVSLLGLNLAFQIASNRELNPFMDLGSRLMALTVGYPLDALLDITHDDEAFYNIRTLANTSANLFGPFFGAALGAFIYIFVIAVNLPDVRERQRHAEYEGVAPESAPTNVLSEIPESQTFVTVL